MKFQSALFLLLTLESTTRVSEAFLLSTRHVATVPHSVSTTSYNDYGDNNDKRSMQNVTSAYMETVKQAVQNEDDSEELEIAKRRQKIFTREGTYRVSLPFLVDQTLGISITSIDQGRTVSEVELNLDTMSIESPPEDTNRIRMDTNQVLGRLDANFRGLVVSAVEPESPAWANPLPLLRTSSSCSQRR